MPARLLNLAECNHNSAGGRFTLFKRLTSSGIIRAAGVARRLIITPLPKYVRAAAPLPPFPRSRLSIADADTGLYDFSGALASDSLTRACARY